MKIKAIVEKPEGTFEFNAELTPMQHQFLIEYAIRDLMTKGLIPFHTPEGKEGEDELVVVSPIFDQEESTKQ